MQDLNVLYQVCIFRRSINKNGRPGRLLEKVAHCTQVQDMWPFGPFVVFTYCLYFKTCLYICCTVRIILALTNSFYSIMTIFYSILRLYSLFCYSVSYSIVLVNSPFCPILSSFYAPGLKGPQGAFSNRIECPSVRQSVRLSVRNSVPATNKCGGHTITKLGL